MENVEINEIGKMGVVTDVMNFDLPPNEITTGDNIRYLNFKIIRLPGFLDMNLDFGAYPDFEIYKISPIQTDIRTGIVIEMRNFGTNKSILLFYDGTSADPSKIYPDEIEAFGKSYFSDIYGAKTINLQNEDPLIFDLNSINARPLENWGDISTGSPAISMTAKILTNFKGFYLAMNTVEDGITYANRIRWSDLIIYPISAGSDPGWLQDDPASLAGFLELPDENNEIVACEKLGDRMIVYTNFSIWSLIYTGDDYVFNLQKLFSYNGAGGPYCVVEFENKHFVLNNSQIYIHDGQTILEVARDKVFNRIIQETNNKISDCILYKNIPKSEIWLCYGFDKVDENEYLNKVAIWNWFTGQWSFGGLPYITDIKNGPSFLPFEISSELPTYDNTILTYDSFNDSARPPANASASGIFTFFASPKTESAANKLYLGDHGYRADTTSYNTLIERNHIDLTELFDSLVPIKRIGRVIPSIRGKGKVKFQFGYSFNLDDSPIFHDPQIFELDTDLKNWKLDTRITGRYFHYKISQDDLDGFFELTNLELELTDIGRR